MDQVSSVEPSVKLAVRPYRPEGGYEMTGLLISLAGGTVAAAVAGFAAHLVAQWLYVILFFPILIGVGVGYVGARAAKLFKVRSPWAAALAGLLAGVSAMACMHYFDYLSARSELNAVLLSKPAKVQALYRLPPEEFERFVQERVRTPKDREDLKTGYGLFNENIVSFMDAQAHQGVEIKRAGDGEKGGVNLGYVGSYIYWLIEIGIVAVIAAGVMKMQASQPFCGRCHVWKREQKLGPMGADLPAAVVSVRSGDTSLIRKAAQGGPAPTQLAAYACPACPQSCEVDAKLLVVIPPKKKKEKPTIKTLAFVTYGQGSLQPLTEAFKTCAELPKQPAPM